MSHSLLYIVTTSCGTLDGYATIDYYGDPYAVLAANKAGDQCWFSENIATATYHLDVYYNTTGIAVAGDCVFDVRKPCLSVCWVYAESAHNWLSPKATPADNTRY